jgi:hypothetical protein
MPYEDVIHLQAKINAPKLNVSRRFIISPYIHYSRYFIPDKKTSFGGGNITSLGLDSQLGISRIILVPNASISWDDGVFSSQPRWVFKIQPVIEWELTNHLKWKIEYTLFCPFYFNFVTEKIPNQQVWGSGLVWKI